MMTRKDYVEVADILNCYKADMDFQTFKELTSDFASFFEEDNPRFKSDKFFDACFKEYKTW